eukprot:2480916-Pyramimonas_sp.AAC.1
MAPMRSILRVLGFSPMYATGLRLNELLLNTKGSDVLLSAGTQETCRRRGGVLRRRCEGRVVIESVFQHGPLTNRSTGCAVCRGKSYRERDIVQTWAAPPRAAGRAVAARVKHGAQDVVYGAL